MPQTGTDGKGLPHSMDGRFWAESLCEVRSTYDVELMHTWFANAIMAGYDEAQRRGELVEKRLVCALHAAYLKHHLDDSSIGWDELDDMLHTLLCDRMGDREFQKWFAKAVEAHEEL